MEKRPAELTVATRQKTGKTTSTGELFVLPSRHTSKARTHALTNLPKSSCRSKHGPQAPHTGERAYPRDPRTAQSTIPA